MKVEIITGQRSVAIVRGGIKRQPYVGVTVDGIYLETECATPAIAMKIGLKLAGSFGLDPKEIRNV